jgi:ElaB/YqjD/DUF883 family membrane-anchored ribosome-binding protein
MNMARAPKLFEALTDSGLRPESAHGVETQVQSSIAQGIERHRQDDHRQVMTKADGLALENNLRSEMIVMKSELRQEMAEMKTELRQEMADMKTELRQEISQLEVRLIRYVHDHGWKMLGFQVATTGLMLTAFKYLH